MRGNGIVSRTWCRPQSHATQRSIPIPNPACGTEPKRRRSRYQSKASRGRSCCGDPGLQGGEVVLALAAADDLAVAVGREHVHAQREPRIRRIGLHVERLGGERIAMHHDRTIELLGQRGLLLGAEIVAPRDVDAGAAQPFDRLAVGDARKGLLHALERRERRVPARAARCAAAAARVPRRGRGSPRPGPCPRRVRRTPSPARPSRTPSGGVASSTSPRERWDRRRTPCRRRAPRPRRRADRSA